MVQDGPWRVDPNQAGEGQISHAGRAWVGLCEPFYKGR